MLYTCRRLALKVIAEAGTGPPGLPCLQGIDAVEALLPAEQRPLPGIGQPDRVQRPEAHVVAAAAAHVSEDPRPRAGRPDVQIEAAAIGDEPRLPNLLDGHRREPADLSCQNRPCAVP